MNKDSRSIENMANLLRQGATLTKYACPACSSPIFKLSNGNHWCANCQKRVIILREGEAEPKIPEKPIFTSLESTIVKKIQQVEKQLVEETDPDRLNKLGKTLSTLLENLEKIKTIKNNPRQNGV